MDAVTEMPLETIGQRISFARERAGLSTAQAARRLGVKTRTLTRWERDENEPRPNRLVMLALMLGVSPAWLLQGADGFEPQLAAPGTTDIRDQLAAVRRAIGELSGIVDGLTVLVERKMRQSHHDAA